MKKDQTGITIEKLQEMGDAAEKEREALLKKRPELEKFQDKIDGLMKGAGSFENRMAVLGVMLESNLKELQKQLTVLSQKTGKWKKI